MCYVTQFCAAGGALMSLGGALQIIGPKPGIYLFDILAALGLPPLHVRAADFHPIATVGRKPPDVPQDCLLSSPVGVLMGSGSPDPCWYSPPRFWEEASKKSHFTAFEIGFYISGPIYLRVGFCPLEFVDFLLGWFGVDIVYDDPDNEDARYRLPVIIEPSKGRSREFSAGDGTDRKDGSDAPK